METPPKRLRLRKVVSGGQTGVDRAALDRALEAGLEIGGWCPPGRAAEDGPIPADLPLCETPRDRSEKAPAVARSLRTEWFFAPYVDRAGCGQSAVGDARSGARLRPDIRCGAATPASSQMVG